MPETPVFQRTEGVELCLHADHSRRLNTSSMNESTPTVSFVVGTVSWLAATDDTCGELILFPANEIE